MAKIKPKEQAIRSKYAGRTDSVTNQKVQAEVMEMYKAENYSPMAGCLPMLIQLPILLALYGIIQQPLKYIANIDKTLLDSVQTYVVGSVNPVDNEAGSSEPSSELYSLESTSTTATATEAATESVTDSVTEPVNISSINVKSYDKSGKPVYYLTEKTAENAREIPIIDILSKPENRTELEENVPGFKEQSKKLQKLVDGFGFFGQPLTRSPSETFPSLLILIPILNFAASFFQTRITKKLNPAAMGDAANNGGMKIMEYLMPLLIVFMSWTMYAALGLYWIFQSVLGIAQTVILAKIYPLPVITEEEYELARQQYGNAKKKKKKKPVVEIEEVEEEDDDNDSNDDDNSNKPTQIKGLKPAEIKDEKYISKTIPKGISSGAKNNYKKSGKKYTFKKKK